MMWQVTGKLKSGKRLAIRARRIQELLVHMAHELLKLYHFLIFKTILKIMYILDIRTLIRYNKKETKYDMQDLFLN